MNSAGRPLHIFLVTRSYPAANDLYRYPFVHRRVLAYQERGAQVTVFRPSPTAGIHEFEGVTCHSGGPNDLERLAGQVNPTVVAIHGLDELMWPTVRSLVGKWPVRAWLHGSEIPDFARKKAEWLRGAERTAAMEAVDRRCAFWRDLLADSPSGFGLVLVSHHSVDLMGKDVPIDDRQIAVIPNPIDTDLFAYREKEPALRTRVLFLRPFDSVAYGNDLAVEAIRLLRQRGHDQLSFTMVGDGPQFDEVMAPLKGVAGVEVSRTFLTQQEIADLHQSHGIFLVPTRLDTQGVSRDEAMSSGLVPVTNKVAAIPEFVDSQCAGLAAPDDASGLAERIAEMATDTNLFLRRSREAAARVRRQSGKDIVIGLELGLLEHAANA